jgi:hypothetical protein
MQLRERSLQSSAGYQKVLLLRFDPPLAAAEKEELYALFRGLAEVPGALFLGFGVDTCGRNRGYQHCLVMSFASEEAYEGYTPHPAHRALAEFVKARRYESLGFNFPLDATSSWGTPS